MSRTFENPSIHNFNDMSISELELLLQLYVENAISIDENALVTITDALAQKNRNEGNIHNSPAESFASFKTRNLANRSFPCPQKANKPSQKRKTSAVAKCCITFVLLFIFGGIIPAAFGQENIFTVVGQWTDEHFSFLGKPVGNAELSFSLQDLRYATTAFCKEKEVVPQWVPEDFSLQTMEIKTTREEVSIVAIFHDKTNQGIYFLCTTTFDGEKKTYEKDMPDAECHCVGEYKFYIMTNNKRNYCTWAINNTECQIWGDLTKEELCKMIESIF